jgi:hypothetical protein
VLYRLLADGVLLVHFGFVVFVVVGGVLVLRRPRLAWLHLPAAAWGVLVQVGNWTCPLTPLENLLRERGGQAGYSGGFVEHYLLSVLYPAGMTYGMHLALGGVVLAVNLYVYGRVLRRRDGAPAARGARPAPAPPAHGLTDSLAPVRSASPPASSRSAAAALASRADAGSG